MALPSDMTKATGLAPALAALEVVPERTVGVGDAENDQAFLRMCGLAVAVDNALPAVKEMADVVTAGARGAGVIGADRAAARRRVRILQPQSSNPSPGVAFRGARLGAGGPFLTIARRR